MKKIVFGLLFFLVLSASVNGQDGDVRFGLQLSPSFSWMTTNSSDVVRSGTNLGLKLAMLSEYYFRENYAVTSGIGFHFNAGGKLLHESDGSYWPNSDLAPNLDSLAGGVKLRYNLQYVEIPVGLKMRTREFGYLRYYLEPNLVMGFRSQSRGDIEGRRFDGGTVGEEGEQINIRQEVGALNLSWGIGAGIEYTLSGTTSIIAGGALQFGFTDATRDKGTTFNAETGNSSREDSKASVNAFTIKLGILF